MTQENRTIESIIQEAELLCREHIPFPVTVWATELPPDKLGRGGEIYGLPVIALSSNLIHLEDEGITDIVLHEIAHVLAWREGDFKHGKQWRRIATLIGATPRARSPFRLRNTPEAAAYEERATAYAYAKMFKGKEETATPCPYTKEEIAAKCEQLQAMLKEFRQANKSTAAA